MSRKEKCNIVKKAKKSNIVVKDGGIRLSYDFNVTETYFPLISHIIRSFMVIFGTITAVLAFTEPFGMPFSFLDASVVVIPVLVTGFILKLVPQKYKWIRILVGIILIALYVISLNPRTVLSGMAEVFTRVYNQETSIYIHSNLVAGYNYYYDMVGALKVITLAVSVMLYISTVNNPNMGMQILATLPLYAFSYIMGMKPGLVVYELMGFYLACYVLGKSDVSAKYRDSRNIDVYEKQSSANISAQIIAIVLCVFIITCIVHGIVRPTSSYRKMDIVNKVYDLATEIVEEVREFVEENIESFQEKIEDMNINAPEKNAVTGFSKGELGEFDSVELSNAIQLKLKDVDRDIQGSIYLRGYIASEYYSGENTSSGRSSWKKGGVPSVKTLVTFYENDIYEKLARFPYEALVAHSEIDDKIAVGSMYIEKINRTEETYFEPSFFQSTMGRDFNLSLDETDENNWQVNLDLNVAHINTGDYTAKELSEIGKAYLLSDEGKEYQSEIDSYREAVYREYVNKDTDVLATAYMNAIGTYYEDVEKQHLQEMIIQLYTNYVVNENVPDLDTALAFVMYMLSDCKYTLSPGATENGEDFVKSFMFDKKKGYCTHFASAAAVMLQEMGIPARYVTGYMVDTREFGLYDTGENEIEDNDKKTYNLSVYQSAAHAWVEVYVDNFGWVVFEPTAAAALSDRGDIGELIQGDIDMPEIDIDNKPGNDDKDKYDEGGKKDEEKGKQIELSKEQKLSLALAVFGMVLVVGVCILVKWRRYRYNKLIKLLESEDQGDKFKGLVILTENLLNIINAPVYFYETREENAKALYDTVFGIVNRKEVNKKNSRYIEPDLTLKEYSFVFEVLSKGNFDKELPEAEKIERAVDFVLYTNEIVYNNNGIFGQFILKYIKCLYLKIK